MLKIVPENNTTNFIGKEDVGTWQGTVTGAKIVNSKKVRNRTFFVVNYAFTRDGKPRSASRLTRIDDNYEYPDISSNELSGLAYFLQEAGCHLPKNITPETLVDLVNQQPIPCWVEISEIKAKSGNLFYKVSFLAAKEASDDEIPF